ncbi:peptide chain release factor N(5)-glutamine methyltransferase [uncultured Paracoccus sp.]|uniref:peptide chain release factor N(5)-glutamine methyltransferase n=1 Tax=uncultured Paracoccus sp. TaxID=189685 RepID=UPI00261C6D36|nr:peptide chain release factor N(5)-glutamine methyltransferase [uncultured Paracoccus sp.]
MTGTAAPLLAATAARLMAAGVDDPQNDARRLVAHALGIAPDRLRMHDLPVTPDQSAALDRAVAARLARQPVSQIVGYRDFWRHRFTVTRDTLDPRPETETLVAAALDLPWRSVLDLGTGTGAILLSLLAERTGASGTGTDLSAAALQVARANADRIGVAADFIQADWFAGVSGRFDLIVSNPPYIAEPEMAALAAEVRDWEPRMALTDGADGLGAYRRIVAAAPAHLTLGGWLLVEIGPTQACEVTALMQAAALGDIRVMRDLDGRDRVVSGRPLA